MNPKLLPLLYLLGTGALIAVSTNLAKYSSRVGLDSVTLLIWSTVGVTVVITTLLGVQQRLPKITPRLIEYSLVSAVIGGIIPNLILFAAPPRVGASFVVLCLAFPPLFTYIGAMALKMERYSHRRFAGVVLALSGATLLAALRLSAPNANLSWIVATLLLPILLAVGNIYRTKRWPANIQPAALVPGILIISSIAYLLLGASDAAPLQLPDVFTSGMLIGAQTVIFTFQYLFFFQLQKRGGPVYLSLLGSITAVVGVPIAVLFLDETLPKGLLPGAVLIISGITLMTRASLSKLE
jgi:drug/metabolite transporter (DMT)-like permease